MFLILKWNLCIYRAAAILCGMFFSPPDYRIRPSFVNLYIPVTILCLIPNLRIYKMKASFNAIMLLVGLSTAAALVPRTSIGQVY